MGIFRQDQPTGFLEYWNVLWLTALTGLLGAGLELFAGYQAVGFLFLVFVMVLGLAYSMGPVLFAAGLSALAWDYLFIPPRFTATINSSEDLMMLVAYAVAAGVVGALTHRLRRMQQESEARDRLSQAQIAFSRIVGADQPRQEVVQRALEWLEERLDLRVGLSQGTPAEILSTAHFLVGDRELELLEKARKAGEALGWDGLYPRHFALPLPEGSSPEAVLLCRKNTDTQWTWASQELLLSAADQLAHYLQRERLREKSQEAARLRESEFLHQALLDSVSHELRTPLTSLLGSTAALEDSARAGDPAARRELLEEIRGAGERLNRVIENLLDMARLNSGALALRKEWHDPSELARLTLGRLQRPLSAHPLRLDLPPELPLVQVDYRLMEHALSNLLLNAAAYAPPGSEIAVSAAAQDGRVEWAVSDRGPGLAEEDLDRVFDKFFRVPGSPAGGTGLGLYITRSLLRAHGGDARARRREEGGTDFLLSVPLEPSPEIPLEASA